MCDFRGEKKKDLIGHFVRRHQKDPRFQVQCTQCDWVGSKWKSYTQHVRRKHPQVSPEIICCFDEFIEKAEDDQKDKITDTLASMFLKLESCHKLTQVALNYVAESLEKLVDILAKDMSCAGKLREQLKGKFSTHYLRQRFYESNSFLVKPKEIVLGVDNTRNKPRHARGYYVPFKKYLQLLLSKRDIAQYVLRQYSSGDTFVRDLKDSPFWKEHAFLSKRPSLGIVLYYDEIDMTNHYNKRTRTTKVGMFYFTLANVPVEHRSKLHNIHLLAIATHKHLRECEDGLSLILGDFLKTVQELRSDGIMFEVNGQTRRISGDLILCVTDTPAGGYLSGMKETQSVSYRVCRMCDVTKSLAPHARRISQCPHKSLDVHEEKVRLLEELRARAKHASSERQRRELAKKITNFSTEWGINGRSPLSFLEDFDYIHCCPYDPMHVLLEGLVPYVLGLFLYQTTAVDKLFTMDNFNKALKSFDYSYLDRGSKPEPISLSFKKNNKTGDINISGVTNTAAGTLTLVYILPYIVGPLLPEKPESPHYIHLLRLINIVLLCTSPMLHVSTCKELECHITIFLNQLEIRYPYYKHRPKFHQLLHLPSQMVLFGPGRLFWSMRFEAKHAFFKQRLFQNHRNLPLSMINTHTAFVAREMYEAGSNGNLVKMGDHVKKPRFIDVKELQERFSGDRVDDSIRENSLTHLWEVSEAVSGGLTYRPGVAVILRWEEIQKNTYEPEMLGQPIFGKILGVFQDSDNRIFFVCAKEQTNFFMKSFNAFCVEFACQYEMVEKETLSSAWPLPIHNYEGHEFITDRYPMYYLDA